MLPDYPQTRQRAARHSRGAWRHCLGHRVLSCMMYVVNFLLPFSQLQARLLSGDGQVGGNPTRTLPGFVGEEGIAYFSSLVLLVLVLLYSIFCL